MSPGKKFERDFMESADDQGVYVYRLKDCAGWRGDDDCPCRPKGKKPTIRFTPSNAYDLIMYLDGTLWTLELKSTKGTSFSFSLVTTDSGEPNRQVRGLTSADREGIRSGFVINYRRYDETFFIPIESFTREMKHGQYKSINVKRAAEIGIKIEQEKRITRFTYLVRGFMEANGYFELGDVDE